MPHEAGGPQALTERIRARLEATFRANGGKPHNVLLCMDDRHPVHAARVILDPVLEPTDKLVWMLLAMQVRKMDHCIPFPDHGTLARQANVSCPSIIAQSIGILRLLRWLTTLTSAHPPASGFTGDLHILHARPLQKADTCHLDGRYLCFVNASRTHAQARIRDLARRVLEDPGRCVQGGVPYRQADDDLSEIQKTVVGCSSSDFNITTTTPDTENSDIACRGFLVTDPPSESPSTLSLVYPPRLSVHQKILANRYLAAVEPQYRQALLDELQGRLECESKGMRPVYDALRFLHALCRAQRQGRFVANLGLPVREARRHPGAPALDEAQQVQAGKERERTLELGRRHLDGMRKRLGMKERNG